MDQKLQYMAQQIPDIRGGERRKRFVTTRKAEQWWIEQSRIRPDMFIWYVSGLPPARHHKIWLANMFNPDINRVNIIAPRDSAKTTIVNYAVAWYLAKYPLSTSAIVSAASDQAESRLRMIKSTIQENTRFSNVFPHIGIDPHLPETASQFTLMRKDMDWRVWRAMVTRHGSLKDPTLKSAGTGSRTLVGSRFSGLLVLDDIMDAKTLGDDNMDKLWRFLTEDLFPAVKEEAKIFSISTRWQLGDVCDRLEATELYKTINIPAEIQDPNTGKKVSYWKEYWPMEKLALKKQEIGDRSYEMMYLNNPQASSLGYFNEEMLSRDLPSPMPQLTTLWISTDQAATETKRSDWNVYMALAEDKDQNIYMLDIDRFKAAPNDQILRLHQFATRISTTWMMPLSGVLVEKVTLGIVFVQAALGNEETRWMPLVSVPLKGRSKEQRISTAVAWAQRRKLFINQEMIWLSQLKTEYINFGTYKNDDTLDPLSLFFMHRGFMPVATELHVIDSPYFL